MKALNLSFRAFGNGADGLFHDFFTPQIKEPAANGHHYVCNVHVVEPNAECPLVYEEKRSDGGGQNAQ